METQVQEQAKPQFDLNAFLSTRRELRTHVEEAFSKLKETKKFDRKDIVKLMGTVMELVSSLDNLSDIMVNDLMIVDKRFAEGEQRMFAIGQGHTVLRAALKAKGIITDEDMEAAWNTEVKPKLEAKIKNMTDEAAGVTAEEPDLIVKPEVPGLVDANGFPLA